MIRAARMSHAPRRQMVGDEYLSLGITYHPDKWDDLYVQNQRLAQSVKREYERGKLICCTLDQFMNWWLSARMIRQDKSDAHVFCRDGESRWCRLQFGLGKCIRGESYIEDREIVALAEEFLEA